MPLIVAIVGRPNVGKSSLFNRIIGEKKAIIDDVPGVTRDLNYHKTEWGGREFIIVDSGGWIPKTQDEIENSVTRRVEEAVEEADVLIFLVDATVDPTSTEEEIAQILRRSGKPVVVAANKIDHPSHEPESLVYYSLGFPEVIPVSAIHGVGTGELLDWVVDHLPPPEEAPPEVPGLVRIAIIGRPNVGKSTLLNSLVKRDRSLVSAQPGTTRDPVDCMISQDGQPFLIVDTAGIRRWGKRSSAVEQYSFLRAEESLWRSNVALLILDAVDGPTESDARVFSLIETTGRAAILLVNKWDIVEKETGTAETFERNLRDKFPFLNFVPVLFISAKTGQRVDRILPLVREVYAQWTRRISTSEINRVLQPIIDRNPPSAKKGEQIKILYVSQVRSAPPTFAIFMNKPQLMIPSYEKYLKRSFYEAFGFVGSPIRILKRSRGREKE
jgi:GTP-binding protein